VVRAPTKAALSPFRTVDRAVVREDFPAFVTEAGGTRGLDGGRGEGRAAVRRGFLR